MDEKIVEFIYESGGIGLEFYNEPEYHEEGIFYTIIDSDDKAIDFKWDDPRFGNSSDYMNWGHFLNSLKDGFYKIKNLNYLYSAMGIDLDIDDLFGSLNESKKRKEPMLALRFDPPLTDISELKKVMRLIKMIYPDVKWKSGNDPTDIPNSVIDVLEAGNDEGFWYITIGFFPDSPKSITYTSGWWDDPYLSDDDHSEFTVTDGRQWLKENDYDADETSEMFGPLVEIDGGFDWVDDIVDGGGDMLEKLPPYEGKRIVLRFNNPPEKKEILNLFKKLIHLGWNFGERVANVNLDELNEEIFRKSGYYLDEIVPVLSKKEGYLHLRPEGNVTFGEEFGKIFYLNDLKKYDIPQIWL